MKLKQLLQSRTHLFENLLHGKLGDVKNPLWLQAFTSWAGLSTATYHFTDKGNYPDWVYAPYCVTRAKLHWPCTLFSPNSLDWILEVWKLITVVSWCCNSHLLWVNASTTGRRSSFLHYHQVTELLYYTKILSLFT